MMANAKNCFFLLLFLTTNSIWANEKHRNVIYGKDDRIETYAVTDEKIREMSKSVAAMIIKDVEPTRSSMSWGRSKPPKSKAPNEAIRSILQKAPTLAEGGYCPTEKFIDQIAVASCTGFLVGEDVLVTAGHCVDESYYCGNVYWAFDYQMQADGKLAEIKNSEIYECKFVMGRQKDLTGKDFAVVRLNRKVTGRTPLKLNIQGKPVVGDDLVMIGYPNGQPQKVAAGAEVKGVNDNNFYANLDAYGGNSGSPVINQRTYEVEGILVFGHQDFIAGIDARTGRDCGASYVLPDETEVAEMSSSISQVFETLKADPQVAPTPNPDPFNPNPN